MENKISRSIIDLPNIETNQLEPLKLVWLTSANDENINDKILLHIFWEITTNIQIFDDPKEFESLFKDNSSNENIFVILNSKFGEQIVSNIHALHSIICMYIFSSTSNEELLWTQNYSKIRSIIYNIDGFIYQLLTDRIFLNNHLAFKAFQIFKTPSLSVTLDIENDEFICFVLFLEVFIDQFYWPLPPSSKSCLAYLHRYYSDPVTSKLIKQFEKDYEDNGSIKTLLNNAPLARFLNQALCELNVSAFFYFRFFLVDIYKYLLDHRLQSANTYMIQAMSIDDIKKLQRPINNHMMFKSFVLTSTNLSSLSIMNVKDQKFQNVLIEIHAENQADTFPFACIEESEISDNRKKILFMPGSIFQIKSMDKITDSTWKLKLILVGHNQFKILSDEQRKLRTEKNLLIISDSFNKYRHQDKSIEYIQHLLFELPRDHNLVPILKEKLNQNSENQPICLHTTQIIVITSSINFSKMESEYLKMLCSISNGLIEIYNQSSEINFNEIRNKNLIQIFATHQTVSTIRRNCPDRTQYFILKENEISQNSEDFILDLADQLRLRLEDESKEDLKNGQNFLGQEKKKLANQIEPEMKKIFQKYSINDINNQLPIVDEIIIVYLILQPNNDDDIGIAIQNYYRNIVTDCLTFYDENQFVDYMINKNTDVSIFLIINADVNDCHSSSTVLQEYNLIKKIYYIYQSSSVNEIMNDNRYQILKELTLELSIHYNNLAILFEARTDSNKQTDMHKKARLLSELLKIIPNIY